MKTGLNVISPVTSQCDTASPSLCILFTNTHHSRSFLSKYGKIVPRTTQLRFPSTIISLLSLKDGFLTCQFSVLTILSFGNGTSSTKSTRGLCIIWTHLTNEPQPWLSWKVCLKFPALRNGGAKRISSCQVDLQPLCHLHILFYSLSRTNSWLQVSFNAKNVAT